MYSRASANKTIVCIEASAKAFLSLLYEKINLSFVPCGPGRFSQEPDGTSRYDC